MALRRANATFEVLDVAYDLDSDTEESISDLANQDPLSWDREHVRKLFPRPNTSTSGVERRLCYGSDFPYRIPNNLIVETEQCKIEFSHGIGGFGNVWGAAMLPYDDYTLRDWPINVADLKASYANVAQYVPLSADVDGLENRFPIYSNRASSLNRSAPIDALLKAFEKREQFLRRHGIEFGRARVAVDSSGGPASCRYCGFCLDGCVYGSIFNPEIAVEGP